MSGMEWNKIAASILLSGLIAMVAAKVTDILYVPILDPKERGYQVEGVQIAANPATSTPKEPVIIKIGALMAAANAQEGKSIAKKCVACHSFVSGGKNKVGPNLWNVLDAEKGHHPDFKYSKALMDKGGKWDYESLYHFLRSPKNFISGTKMSFAGLKTPEEVADVIAYLRESASSPKPLPSPDATLME